MNTKIPQGTLGTKLDKREKKRLTNINAGVRGSVEQSLGKIKRPGIETLY